MSPEQAFGRVLRQLRRKCGLSQERLALECGFHRTCISLLERGKHSPTVDALFRIHSVLKVSPSRMLRMVEPLVTSIREKHAE